MFLQKGFTGKNNFWRYLVTISAVFVATQVASLPLVFILMYKALKSGLNPSSSDLMNFSAMGLDLNLGLFLMLITFAAGLAVLWLMIKHLHKKKFRDVLTGRNKIDWARIIFSGSVWLGLLVIIHVVHYVQNPGNMVFQFEGNTFIILMIVALLFIPIQTSFEEITFRGYLTQGFAIACKYRWIAILIPAILFAALHAMNPEVKEFGFFLVMPQYLIIGLLLGIITVLDDGVESALGFHAINNIFLAIFITHKSSALQTSALFEVKEIDPVLDLIELAVASVLFILILSAKYKWKNWGKLFGKVRPQTSTL